MKKEKQTDKYRGKRRCIYVDPALWLEVQKVAYARKWTVSQVIRHVLVEHIGQYVVVGDTAVAEEGSYSALRHEKLGQAIAQGVPSAVTREEKPVAGARGVTPRRTEVEWYRE